MNPLVSIARFLALGIHKSKVPTGFTPLSKVRVVTVMLDAEGKDAQSLVDSVNKYFSSKGIRAEIFALSREKKPVALKGAGVLYQRPHRQGLSRCRHRSGNCCFYHNMQCYQGIQKSLPQIRQIKRIRPGKRHRYPRGQGLCQGR